MRSKTREQVGLRRFKRQHPTVCEACEDQGWQYDTTNNGHLRFKSPDGRHIVMGPGTPSSARAWRNMVADLKRKGLKV